jgi:hypothetical protein
LLQSVFIKTWFFENISTEFFTFFKETFNIFACSIKREKTSFYFFNFYKKRMMILSRSLILFSEDAFSGIL